jgi:hypothetical protein
VEVLDSLMGCALGNICTKAKRKTSEKHLYWFQKKRIFRFNLSSPPTFNKNSRFLLDFILFYFLYISSKMNNVSAKISPTERSR